jgi:High potential iron-sulfur protein
MKRREFLGLGMAAVTLGGASLNALANKPAAGKGAALAEKDILKEGMPTTIANYCEDHMKQPNKFCPSAPKDASAICSNCMFYNKDNSETTFKGKKYARCSLLTDPKKPQFVLSSAWCQTYVKKP